MTAERVTLRDPFVRLCRDYANSADILSTKFASHFTDKPFSVFSPLHISRCLPFIDNMSLTRNLVEKHLSVLNFSTAPSGDEIICAIKLLLQITESSS